MSVFIDGINDPEYMRSFEQIWRELINHGLSIAAFTEDPSGGKPIMAGLNVLTLSFKDEKFNLDEIKVISIYFLQFITATNSNIFHGVNLKCILVEGRTNCIQCCVRFEQGSKCV